MELNSDFQFDMKIDNKPSWDFADIRSSIDKEQKLRGFYGSSIHDKVSRLRSSNPQKLDILSMDIDIDQHEHEEEKNEFQDDLKLNDDKDDDKDDDNSDFLGFHLSRPLLKALNQLGFLKPTPVQKSIIPLALDGKDLLICATTGSGKTAAFILPVLERLLRVQASIHLSRVLILCPTRELSAQCYSMTQQLSLYTYIRSCMIVGGLSKQIQEPALRKHPEIIIATPGRLIDLLRNASSFHLDTIEVLILDEADRLLEMGFMDEVKEVISACPTNRQTILLSATLSSQVTDLANIVMNKAEFVSVDPIFSLSQGLVQEFIRIRPENEIHRESIVLSICRNTYKSNTIIFCKSKVRAHRLLILFLLAGLQASELHGNMTQSQRLEALDAFRLEKVDFLICTDLASRGLDIPGLNYVINMDMPKDITQYVHRVGRTARAGKSGRSISLVGEYSRKLLKEIIKHSSENSVRTRNIAATIVNQYNEIVKKFTPEIHEILKQEREEKEIRVAEMMRNRAENLIVHEEEIFSNPKTTWFQSENQRRQAKNQGRKDWLKSNKNESKATKFKDKNSKKKIDKPNESFAIQKIAKRKDKSRSKELKSKLNEQALLKEAKFSKKRKRIVSRYQEDFGTSSFDKRYQNVVSNENDEATRDVQKKKIPGNFKSKMRYKRHKK